MLKQKLSDAEHKLQRQGQLMADLKEQSEQQSENMHFHLSEELQTTKNKLSESKTKFSAAEQQLKYANTLMQVSARRNKEQLDEVSLAHSKELQLVKNELVACKSRLSQAENDLRPIGKDSESSDDSHLGFTSVIAKVVEDRNTLTKELSNVKNELKLCQHSKSEALRNSDKMRHELESHVSKFVMEVLLPSIRGGHVEVLKLKQQLENVLFSEEVDSLKVTVEQQEQQIEEQQNYIVSVNNKLKHKASELATSRTMLEARVLKQTDDLQDVRKKLKQCQQMLERAEQSRDKALSSSDQDAMQYEEQIRQLSSELSELKVEHGQVDVERQMLMQVTEELRAAHRKDSQVRAAAMKHVETLVDAQNDEVRLQAKRHKKEIAVLNKKLSYLTK